MRLIAPSVLIAYMMYVPAGLAGAVNVRDVVFDTVTTLDTTLPIIIVIPAAKLVPVNVTVWLPDVLTDEPPPGYTIVLTVGLDVAPPPRLILETILSAVMVLDDMKFPVTLVNDITEPFS